MIAVDKIVSSEPDVNHSPENWSATRLGNISSIRKTKGAATNGIKCIELEHIESETGRIIGWDDTGTQASIKTAFLKNDVLFGKLRPYLRKFAIAPFNGICTTEILAIYPIEGQTIKGFLFYLIQSDIIFDVVNSISFGTKMPRVSWSDLSEIVVPIPPLNEQQKIADILTTVDDKLEVITRQIAATQTLKQGLLRTLFSRGVGTQDAKGNWVPHVEFKESDLGVIPVSWQTSTVGAVCDVKGGKRLPKGESLTGENTGFPYIRVTDMHMGGVNVESIQYVPVHLQPTIARYTISVNDIFITVAGTIGIIGMIPKELDGANLTENANKLTNISISRDYLFYVLCSDNIQGAIKLESTANAQPKLALTRIRNFEFPLPPNEEQVRIAEILKTSDTKLRILIDKKTHYQTLKRGLMQKLLTGEWRLNVEEPNSEDI